MSKFILVGDVGGTNARLALCDMADGAISHIHTYSANDYATLEDVITHYLEGQRVTVHEACIAIACPITNDWVDMTNHSWAFSINSMKLNLGLNNLEVINDFKAVSMSIPMLHNTDLLKFGGGHVEKDKPIVVYGAGTGLGVCHLIQTTQQVISLPGEGGHVDFAPNSAEEDLILSTLRSEHGRISYERVLSGPGLVNLYRGIVKVDGRIPEKLKPKDITDRALNNECTDCRRALSLFCILLGRFGGNLALTMGTFGGVYIAGGIVPRFLDFFRSSGFRSAFEDKGRFNNYLKDIPVFLITHPQPGLLGAGAHMRQLLGYSLN
ncbi:glucokinase [Salmonella enterica]|uniref:glucokinase n=1 Tax=Salmonella enterica TaxID=28901 RepID=UPI00126D8A08|nr:glucokinase [Salmonella enterica]ECD0708771.1 glucokinase [Salmonella enterica subsp. enterica serovar Monschaui]EDT2657383.1 glucokinase [Salmonella enterica subsp. enterica serovar Ago]EBN2869692.1 glucokinase [Salmonella enterica]ECG2088143.1 glucokinase [Salmonella enterica subsp. enterica serovar Monschaui]